MTDRTTLELLEEGRRREKEQTAFYRSLASLAEELGDGELAERLNSLHADEQHHLSRLTARILELGGTPRAVPPPAPGDQDLRDWEETARTRETGEVAWYEKARLQEVDRTTRSLLDEILESERHHARELGGKWMSS